MSVYDQKLIIDSKKYSYVVNKLRSFFLNKGYVECHTQNRLSILAACEDPSTISLFNYTGHNFPLPQTGQMWLEYELMHGPPDVNGYFTVSTSYRNEPNPVEGRHDLIFPMFEFEMRGNFARLADMECELLSYLGYSDSNRRVNYNEMADKYGVMELTHEHEARICEEYGPATLLMNFPEHTSPFFNMKRNHDMRTANKIDVLMSGMETIGSAERSCDVEDMRTRFHMISGGMYAKTLYGKFGKERVNAELEDFLKLPMVERSGGGIGITRLIKSMEKEGLMFKD
jgi:aspartyl/asparaginyl-tRNA synthetase